MPRSKPMIDSLCCDEAEIISFLEENISSIQQIVDESLKALSIKDYNCYSEKIKVLTDYSLEIENYRDGNNFNLYEKYNWYQVIKKTLEIVDKTKIDLNTKTIKELLEELNVLCKDLENSFYSEFFIPKCDCSSIQDYNENNHKI